MNIAEDQNLGLMAVDIEPGRVRRYGRMKYNAQYVFFVTDCALTLSEFISFPTKKIAFQEARNLGFTNGHVVRIGSRFWSAWGIRHDLRDRYFLADY